MAEKIQQLFNNRSIQVLIFLYGILLSALYAGTIIVDQDINQLLERGALFMSEGTLVPFGNIGSSGVKSFVPGSFLSAATGLPMLLWHSPYAALVLIGLLHAIGFFFVVDVLKNFYSGRLIVLYLILFWVNPWRTSEVFLWNPAYLFFFSSMHLWSLYKTSEKPSFLYSALHVISMFGALQAHNSFIILPVITLLMWWKKAAKPHWMGVFAGTAISLATLVPYFIEKMNRPEDLETTINDDTFLFRGIIVVYPFLKGIWYWVRHGSFLFPKHIFSKTTFGWIGDGNGQLVLKIIWNIIIYAFTILTVLFSFRANYRFAKANKFQWKIWNYNKTDSQNWLNLYILMAFWALMFAAAITPTDPVFWHFLILYPIAILVPLIALDQMWQQEKYKKWVSLFLVVSLVYFGFFTAFSSLESRKHNINNNLFEFYQNQYMKDQ